MTSYPEEISSNADIYREISATFDRIMNISVTLHDEMLLQLGSQLIQMPLHNLLKALKPKPLFSYKKGQK